MLQRNFLKRQKYLAYLILSVILTPQSAWATCIGSYCDIDHNTYGSPAACASACVSGGGGGTTTPSYSVIKKIEGTGSGTIEETTVPADYTGQTPRVKLTAVPDATSQFVSWSNSFAPECTGTMAEVTVTLDVTKTCIATFEAIPTPVFQSSLSSDATLNFGNTAITLGNFTISEGGNADLIISKAAITGTDAADFSILSPNFPLTIANGGMAQPVTIQCKAASTTRTATLELTTNDAEFPTVQYPLTCDPVGNISNGSVKYSSVPEVNQLIDLGSTPIGKTISTTIQISAQSTSALTVNLKELVSPTPNDFKLLANFPLSITDCGCTPHSVEIQCTPTTTGSRVAVLQLTTNDPIQTTASYTFVCSGSTTTTSTSPPIDLTVVAGGGVVKTPSLNGHVNEPTNNSNQTAINLTIGTEGSISGGILSGKTVNQGLLSNVTLANDATLAGGKLSGFNTNQGLVRDVTLSQYSQITGGNYAGTVTNNGMLNNAILSPLTQVQNKGTLQSPLLLPGAQITGGKLTGTAVILGKLQDVTIAPDAKIITQVKDIPVEFFRSFTAQTLAFLPKTVLSEITPEQFAEIPLTALPGLNADNMGGFSPIVINSMTEAQIQALDKEAFKQMPEDGIAKYLTNFNETAITVQQAQTLLPPQWSIDSNGNLTAPVGTQISFRSLSTPATDGLILPPMSDLNSNFALSGHGTTPTILQKLNQIGENSEFTVLQQNLGVVRASVSGATAQKSKFAFMTDPNHLFILDEAALRGLQLNEQGQYVLVTDDGLQIPIIPMTQDPEDALKVLGNKGALEIRASGEVLLQQTVAVRSRAGESVHSVVMFDPFIEPAPADICVTDPNTGQVTCDWTKADQAMQPGLRTARNLRANAAAKLIYSDGTSQKLYPTVLLPDTLVAELKKIKTIRDAIFRMDGTVAVTYQDGKKSLLIADFNTKVQVATTGEVVTASLQLQADGSYLYQVPYQNQLFSVKLATAELPK